MDNFTKLYQKGDLIKYEHEGVLKTEEKILKVSTVYPKTIIATEERGMSYCIDWKNQDKILFLGRGDV